MHFNKGASTALLNRDVEKNGLANIGQLVSAGAVRKVVDSVESDGTETSHYEFTSSAPFIMVGALNVVLFVLGIWMAGNAIECLQKLCN